MTDKAPKHITEDQVEYGSLIQEGPQTPDGKSV